MSANISIDTGRIRTWNGLVADISGWFASFVTPAKAQSAK